jgi:propionate CoA-transferase
MALAEKIKTIAHLIHWRLNWDKKNLGFLPPENVSAKFITARHAASLIPNEAVCISSGIAGNARCSVFFWAIRESFQKKSHPSNLTWINIAAQGGRGKVPGTIEEIGLPGLLKCYITGHHETAKAQLKMAADGKLELHALPQGVMSFILEEMGKDNHKNYYYSIVGLNTFFDPRTGNGTAISAHAKNKLVSAEGDLLRYSMPRIDIAFFCAPYADREGNIYFHHAATISENKFSAKAARANGGKVMATVSAIIPKNETLISMPAADVDYIVVHPYNEQTATVKQKKFWPVFTPYSQEDPIEAINKIRFINRFLRITPLRGKTDHLLGRLGALVFAKATSKGALVNIGVGFPEEVAGQLMKYKLHHDINFTTEAGAYGGLPASGVFFGASIHPEHLEPSTETFYRYLTNLDAAILGFLQIDSLGNVNASKRGEKITEYVGAGGFPDIASGAKVVLFVGTWMSGGKFVIKNDKLLLAKKGKPKFVNQVDQVTFNGEEALKSGKKIFYITNVGVFTLTEKGLMLIMVMPGIDIEKDIINACEATIILPDDKPVTVVDASIFKSTEFKISRDPVT